MADCVGAVSHSNHPHPERDFAFAGESADSDISDLRFHAFGLEQADKKKRLNLFIFIYFLMFHNLICMQG
jgi:hypothetical protein